MYEKNIDQCGQRGERSTENFLCRPVAGVRSGCSIGFVKNANRMNVAVSRMKYQLIVIGCHFTLCTDPKWRSLYSKAQRVDGGAMEDMPLLPPGKLP